MPITRRQFELGIDDTIAEWITKVHALLAESRDQAFTLVEITSALKTHIETFQSELRRARGIDPDAKYVVVAEPPIDTALAKLQELSAADAREVDSQIYYAYRGDLPDLR